MASDCNIGSDLHVIIVITLIHATPGNKQDQGSFASHCPDWPISGNKNMDLRNPSEGLRMVFALIRMHLIRIHPTEELVIIKVLQWGVSLLAYCSTCSNGKHQYCSNL